MIHLDTQLDAPTSAAKAQGNHGASSVSRRIWQRPSRRRRILLVTPQPFYEDRGTPIAVGLAARALSELGHELDVLSFPFGITPSLPRVQTIRCGNPLNLQSVPIGFSWQKCVLDASLVRSLSTLLRERSYDVVHAVEEAAYLAKHYCRGLPYIYDMASSIPEELAQKQPLFGSAPMRKMLAGLEKSVLNHAAHVVCSAGLGAHVQAQACTTPVTEWRFPAVLPPPDPRRVAQIRQGLQLPAGAKIVLYCGNFARYQGLDLLFDAFARISASHPELALVLVGATEKEQDLWTSRLSPELKNRVRIVPRQRRDQVGAFLALADCLVSLRPISRNLPLKLFEYMATGRPIVATRGPAHETVLNPELAFLCDSTPESIGAAICKVFRSPLQARRVARAANAYATRHFGWDGFVELLDGVYDSALSGQPN